MRIALGMPIDPTRVLSKSQKLWYVTSHSMHDASTAVRWLRREWPCPERPYAVETHRQRPGRLGSLARGERGSWQQYVLRSASEAPRAGERASCCEKKESSSVKIISKKFGPGEVPQWPKVTP